MSHLARRLASPVWFLCIPLLFPVLTHSAQAQEIRVGDDEVVSRGDFIRAVVRAYDIDTEDTVSEPLPFLRVPSALRPFVRAAYAKDALGVFGTDLQLARGITRGEALRLAVLLGEHQASEGVDVDFKDVRSGSEDEKAVAVAIEQDWLQPLRESIFGVRRMLTGKDANLLIRKLKGEHLPAPARNRQEQPEMQTPPTIRVQFERTSRPLPKSEILQTLWQLINDEYLYDEKIDQDEAAYSAAEALMKSLGDPYTTFMRPVQSRSFQTQIRGEVSGIGAQVEYIDKYLTIVSPLRGSPAEEAGIKPGDIILAVDGANVVGIGFIEAVEHVRGPKGSTAVLRIRRNGIEFDVSVKRDTIKVPEIDVSWQGKMAIVKLLQFGRVTHSDLRGVIEEINSQEPEGLVLDLRSNPGGLLDAARSVLGNFVEKGSIVAKIDSRNSTRTEKTFNDPSLDPSVRMVVLINGGSASASEIVAGALQDHGRATVVGEKSFGKGTVQQVLQFNDQSSMKMTVAEWLTPEGRKINGVGILPDIEVLEDERDEQMSRALELLRR
jgi:carboxyl-terminal processing protease